MKPLQVKLITIAEGKDKGKKAYGVTDGKKWHVYAFKTEEAAKRMAENIDKSNSQQVREVNVGYTQQYVMYKDI